MGSGNFLQLDIRNNFAVDLCNLEHQSTSLSTEPVDNKTAPGKWHDQGWGCSVTRLEVIRKWKVSLLALDQLSMRARQLSKFEQHCFIKWHVWKKEYVCGLLPARKKIKIRPPARPPAQPRPPQTSSSSLWPSSCAAPTPPPFHLARQWTQAEESSDPLSSPSPSSSPLLPSYPTPLEHWNSEEKDITKKHFHFFKERQKYISLISLRKCR